MTGNGRRGELLHPCGANERIAKAVWGIGMIVRKRPNAFALFFIVRGSVVQRIWVQVVGVALLSAGIVAVHRHFPNQVPSFGQAPFALVGIALSIFLSFRNGASYDRWWEARKLWGEIILAARDLARQTLILDDAPGRVSEGRRNLLEGVIVFAREAVRLLRGHPPFVEGSPHNPPDAVLHGIGAELAGLLRAGRLTDIQFAVLNETVGRLSHALVGCERMVNTPLPFSYALLLHRTAYLFCFLLPFGFADILGWTTPVAVALVAYTFFGLDALGDELEEPFGLLPNDLPIAAYATMVEITLREAMGDAEVPPMPTVKDFVLI